MRKYLLKVVPIELNLNIIAVSVASLLIMFSESYEYMIMGGLALIIFTPRLLLAILDIVLNTTTSFEGVCISNDKNYSFRNSYSYIITLKTKNGHVIQIKCNRKLKLNVGEYIKITQGKYSKVTTNSEVVYDSTYL